MKHGPIQERDEKMKWIRRRVMRVIRYMTFDFLIILSVHLFAIITYNSSFESPIFAPYETFFLIMLPTKMFLFFLFKFYHFVLDYVGLEDVFKIGITVVVANLILFGFFKMGGIHTLPLSLYFLASLFEALAIAAVRLWKRIVNYLQRVYSLRGGTPIPEGNGRKRTLIIGSGSGGVMVLKELRHNLELNAIPIAFVDDDVNKIGEYIKGVEIIGPIANINHFIDQYDIHEVIIGIANLSATRMREILELVSRSNVTIRRLPLMKEIEEGSPTQLVEVKIEDLLNRDEIHLDIEGIRNFLAEKTILVTGAGGSIGSELCRQIYQQKPKRLVLFDIYENGVYDIQMELLRHAFKHDDEPQCEIVVRIGSVYNATRLEEIFAAYHPDIVFHAAAYKHVPLMEDSPMEAIRTNGFGTYNTAKLALQYGVQNFVLVSSDKAVRPTNVMGATKRFAERIVQYFATQSSTTRFSMVRFGNVLGSNGSVVPLFKKQILDGGPVTVTHPEITRFFMTIPEAVGLILQSAVYSSGGEVFILDMGEPVKIRELAEKMIRLSGFQPGVDIKIEYVGLRPGEKLYEELLVNHQTAHNRTDNKRIFVEPKDDVRPIEEDMKWFASVIDHQLSNEEIKAALQTIITTYHHEH